MDTEKAIETRIKPQLIEAFGRQLANSLLTHATLAYVTTDGSEEERFEALVNSICSDDHVLSIWDERTVARRKEEWEALVIQGETAPGFSEQERSEGGAMTGRILDGRALAKEVKQEVIAELEDFRETYGFAPAISVVRIGEDPASVSYAKMIKRSFEKVGLGFELHTLSETASQGEVMDWITWLNVDDSVQGIMIQEPMPRSIDAAAVRVALWPDKDVDGVSPINAGRLAQVAPIGRPPGVEDYLVPATPLGGLELLKRNGIEIEGKRAVVVGRSNIVGKPMAFLLMQHQATVTICHSRTENLVAVCRQADILCAAVGRAKLITADMIKPGAAVLDFGFNRLEGEWVGDVDFEAAKEIAGAITPVPGGTGSMTTVMLMKNLLEAARRQVE